MRKSVRCGVAAGWAVLACAGVWAAEEPQPPADAALRGRIEALVKDLGSTELAKRETATQELARIGDPAVHALYKASKSGDVETSLRAQQLLKDLKWVSPEIHKKIAALRKTRDAEAWKTLWREIVDAGDEAKHWLEQELNTPYGEASLKVEGIPARAKRGASATVSVAIRNEGQKGFWIQKDKIKLYEAVAQKWSASKDEKTDAGNGMGGLGAVFNMAQMMGGGAPAAAEDGVPYIYVAPGEAYAQKIEVEGKDLDFTGRLRVQAFYNGSEKRSAAGGGFNLQALMAMRGGGIAPEAPVAARTLARDVFGESAWTSVMPDAGRSGEGMSLAFAEGTKPVVEKGAVSVKVSLSNTGKETAAVPAPTPQRTSGYWYALLNDKGDVAQFGRLDGQEERASAGRMLSLSPGKKVEAEGRIAAAVPPGKYKLVCGFSMHEAPVAPANPMGNMRIQIGGMGQPEKPAEEEESKGKDWSGDAVTPPVEVEIK